MRKLRRLGAQSLENQHVLEGVGEMILAANNVADAQVHIVGAGRHVVHRHAVAAQQREIFDIGREFGLLAINGVLKLHGVRAIAGHAKSQNKRLAGIGATLAFFRRKLAHPGIEEPRDAAMFLFFRTPPREQNRDTQAPFQKSPRLVYDAVRRVRTERIARPNPD